MDQRLLDYLQQHYKALKSNLLAITHQQIAINLHSSREVISKLLKKLEQAGMVRLHRNEIEYLMPVSFS